VKKPARVSIRPANPVDAVRVARAMRAADLAEVMALRPAGADPATLVVDAVEADGAWAFCAKAAGRPVALLGAVEARPALWSVWMVATDAWPAVAPAVFRFARRTLIPGLLAAGANRAVCRSLAGHGAAHRWLERLGAVHECDMPDCGEGRATFRLYAWRRGDFEERPPSSAPAGHLLPRGRRGITGRRLRGSPLARLLDS